MCDYSFSRWIIYSRKLFTIFFGFKNFSICICCLNFILINF